MISCSSGKYMYARNLQEMLDKSSQTAHYFMAPLVAEISQGAKLKESSL